MIPIVGRLTLGLARLFGVPGQGPTILDGTVFPVVEIDSDRPEMQFIKTERLMAGSSQIAGGAGTRSAINVGLLATAANLTIIERIEFYVGAATNIEMYIGNIPVFGTAFNVGPRDTRIINIGPFGGPTSLTITNAAAAAPAVARAGLFTLTAAGLWTITDPIVLSPPVVAGQTNSVQLITSANNVGIACTVWFRERPIASGENLV